MASDVGGENDRDVTGDRGDHCEVSVSKRMKLSRNNTAEEKKRMRNSRKKRKRSKKRNCLLKAVVDEQELRKQSETKVLHYRSMARSYWERWQWELRQRREAMMLVRSTSLSPANSTSQVTKVHEIDPTLLHDPVKGSLEKVFLGQGSFSVVKLQFYRGIKVAVKELQPRTLRCDVQNEARVLAQLCHPFLPYLFGISTTVKPYRIVMQFHGIGDTASSSLTLSQAISKKKIKDGYAWLGICAQLMEAIDYLHEEACILHNDITTSNILLTDSLTEKQDSFIQIIIIDFGKATAVKNNRKYHLSDVEKSEYTRRFPHISPEVIDGITTYTKWSDMYSAGRIMQQLIDGEHFEDLSADQRISVNSITRKCMCHDFPTRSTAKQVLVSLQCIG